MKISVIGSSSKGNGYLLHSDNEALIIECGVRFAEVKKLLDYNTSIIAGCLVTHEHGDHAKYVSEYTDNGFPLIMSEGTLSVLKKVNAASITTCKEKRMFNVGNFSIIPFKLQHDCVEPFGYLIKHKDIGVLLFATDTYFLPNRFPNVNHVLIECNYRQDILERNLQNGRLSSHLYKRTLYSHMSYATCVETIKTSASSNLKTIMLIHLSDANSSAEEFKRGIEKEFGIPTFVAEKGVSIELGLF